MLLPLRLLQMLLVVSCEPRHVTSSTITTDHRRRAVATATRPSAGRLTGQSGARTSVRGGVQQRTHVDSDETQTVHHAHITAFKSAVIDNSWTASHDTACHAAKQHRYVNC